ncbi:hypothetical protein [Streptomyces sp. JB150]|uniref:hypothetical protein n=1 Tax=Streptomyces sp. JB150 TaxID=2714844 RepID=UPI001409DAB2|nr:hypothetical protein [Streptomyces sp. JB150]QIJ62564.1 hypothetical protein G7Z13_11340 [Streptomyces sp. JB150]
MGRHRWRRLAVLLGTLVERVRHWAALVRADKNYGRAKRLAKYLVGVTAATVIGEVLSWLLHGR